MEKNKRKRKTDERFKSWCRKGRDQLH